MPGLIALKSGQISQSKLEGDELRVHPEVFGRMQDAAELGDGDATQRAAQAMRIAGLSEEEIAGRTFRNTKIVVDPTLVSSIPYTPTNRLS